MADFYQLHVHPIPYRQKPTHQQAGKISLTITENVEAMTPKDISKKLSDGHSVVLGIMDGERNKENLTSQQILMLDFDNTVTVNGVKQRISHEYYVTLNDVLANPWMRQHAAFMYKSFSYTDDWQRFRVVIFLDKLLRTHQEVTSTYEWLMNKYPDADPSPKDCSRIFYGGTEVIEINFDNTWTPEQLVKKEKSLGNQTKFKNVAALTRKQASQMIRAYIDREIDNLQEYGNALSAISVIGKSVLSGEIEEEWARDYVDWLALDKADWKRENQTKLNEFLGKTVDDIYTNYTFREKFASTNNKDEFDVFKFTEELVRNYDIIRYKNKIYAKDGLVWRCDGNKLLRLINQVRQLKRNQDAEVVHQIEKNAVEYEEEIRVIQLVNNYQIKDGEVRKGASEEFTPYLLDVDYDKEAYNKDVDDFLNFLVMDRPELRLAVEELLGHVLLLRGFPHKVFFLIGEKGANGKSTFLEMLNNFVGDLGSNINLEAFNDNTSVAELEDKLVNIGDDIDASYLDKSMNFKTLASGNTIMVRPIYQQPRKLKNTATLIFTANEMPTFRDKTGGIERRLAIIPCDNVVKEADFGMDEKLSTDNAKSYLLNLALQGVDRIRANGGQLSESDLMKSILRGYMADTDSILGFIEDEGIDQDVDKKVVYQSYCDYCSAIGTKPQKMAALTRKLTSIGYVVRDTTRLGKRAQIYVLEEN